jgi:hypothetical protein
LFNVYFPCYTNTTDYEFDILNIIAFCENILLENVEDDQNTYVIIGGDFNVDESKIMNDEILRCFKNFMLMTDLVVARNDIQYTFHCETRNCYSNIDHFIISKFLQCKCM